MTCPSKRVLDIDIETYSDVSLSDCGVYRYAEDPSFEILLLSASYDGGPVVTYQLAAGDSLPDSLIRDLTDPAVLKEAHNAQFERVCLSAYLGWPTGTYLDPAQWFCTMAHANNLSLPPSLKSAGEALGLSEDNQKLKSGGALIRFFSVPIRSRQTGALTRRWPWTDWNRWNLYVRYNAQDVVTELKIEEQLAQHPMCEFERQVYELDQRIADRGILIDMDFVRSVESWNNRRIAKILEDARDLTGLANPNSPKQLLEWFESKEIPIESTKEEVLSEWIGKTGDPDTEQMIQYKLDMSKTSLKKYSKLLEATGSDGRIRGTLMYYGANRTGRWAGRLVQVQNLPRTYLDDAEECRDLIKAGDFDCLELLHENLPDTVSQLIRTAFVAPEGKTFVVCDYSAIEARVIAWLAQEEWRQKAFEKGEDIYCTSASMMFGVPVVKHGENGELRQKGKVAELALGYGGGVAALKAFHADDYMSEPEMKDVISKWRAASPKIVKLWNDIAHCVELTDSGRLQSQLNPHSIRFFKRNGILFVRLPSGRHICYHNMHSVPDKWGRKGFEFTGVTSSKKWAPIRTWGGTLAENLTRAIARDCLATAMLRLDAAGYDIVFHVHDEVIVECDKRTAKDDYETIQRIMSQPIEWAPGLVLTAEGFISDFYKKD